MTGQVLVHLTYQSGTKWLVACIQGNTEYKVNGAIQHHPIGSMISGDPRAVTCPLCKKTQVCIDMESKLPR